MKSGLLLASTLVIMATGIWFSPSAWAANPHTGDYFGTASIDSPAGLGTVDLAFHLELYANGNMWPAKSYVILEKTILFPKVAPQIGKKDVGPRVQTGYLEPDKSRFFLKTKTFPSIMFPGTGNERTVTRQITLKEPTFSPDGTISGVYLETITGYLSKPITVTGTFVIAKPK